MQTTSRRLADRKIYRFEKNITKRGSVSESTAKKGKDYPVGPILLGFFVFVVVGSCKSSFVLPQFLCSCFNLCHTGLIAWFGILFVD